MVVAGSLDQKLDMLSRGQALAEEFTEMYPQQGSNGIEYVFGGSLTALLLSRAEVLVLSDREHAVELEVPDETSGNLLDGARFVSDIDIINYNGEDFPLADDEKNHVYKIPSHLFSSDAIAVIRPAPEEHVHVDSLRQYTNSDAVVAVVHGEEFLIEDPRDMIAHKFLYVAFKWTSGSSQKVIDNKHKHTKDLEMLRRALLPMFSDDEFAEAAYEALVQYEEERPYLNEDLLPARRGIRTLYFRAIEYPRDSAVDVLARKIMELDAQEERLFQLAT